MEVAPFAGCVCPSFDFDLVSGVLMCQCRWLSLESTVRKQLGGSNTALRIDCFYADQTVFLGCILAALAGLVFALTAVQYAVARKAGEGRQEGNGERCLVQVSKHG